jgi:glycerophosphoryl diester phosphodiesterase
MSDRLGWLTARPIAHRGYHDRAAGRPENTLGAAAAAIAADYAIECDVHLSADGIPVVFHDDTLDRLTGESGTPGARDAAALGALRVLGSAEHVPTLDALLALVEGQVPLVIEMKDVGAANDALAAATVERLRGYSGKAALMSFAPPLLAAARRLRCDRPLGLTAEGDWRRAAEHLGVMRSLKLDFISYAIDDLPTPMPILARRLLRVPLICWTVRTGAQLRKARKWTDQITIEGFQA